MEELDAKILAVVHACQVTYKAEHVLMSHFGTCMGRSKFSAVLQSLRCHFIVKSTPWNYPSQKSALGHLAVIVAQAGLDSLGAIELRNAVRACFGVEVPATLALDYPTTDALAAYLGDLLAQKRVAAPISTGPENILALAERAVAPLAVDVISAAAMYPGAEHSGESCLQNPHCMGV